jgi:hypothetical protein
MNDIKRAILSSLVWQEERGRQGSRIRGQESEVGNLKSAIINHQASVSCADSCVLTPEALANLFCMLHS